MVHLGKVRDAKVLKEARDRKTRRLKGLNGLILEFITDITINVGMIVEIKFEDKEYHYKIAEIEIEKQKLVGRITETGFYTNSISRIEELDLRYLIGLEVYLVEDVDKISKIREESLYT